MAITGERKRANGRDDDDDDAKTQRKKRKNAHNKNMAGYRNTRRDAASRNISRHRLVGRAPLPRRRALFKSAFLKIIIIATKKKKIRKQTECALSRQSQAPFCKQFTTQFLKQLHHGLFDIEWGESVLISSSLQSIS